MDNASPLDKVKIKSNLVGNKNLKNDFGEFESELDNKKGYIKTFDSYNPVLTNDYTIDNYKFNNKESYEDGV